MALLGRGRTLLYRCLLAASLSSTAGCMSVFHPVAPPPKEIAHACHDFPHYCYEHVYVFMIHGMDPLDFANLSGVNNYLHQLGILNTYYGQLYHTGHFKKEMCRIHDADPEAHFVLIGFSFGANMVRDMALRAKEKGINVDLIVYLGGNTLENIPTDRPDNAGRIVNILASGFIWNGAQLDGAVNMHETDVWHFGSPTHRRTLEVLNQELLAVLSSVPVPTGNEAPMPTTAGEPTPRNTPAMASTPRDDWDFLKPVSRIKTPVEAPAQTAPSTTTPAPDPAKPAPAKKEPVKEKVASYIPD